MTPDERLIARLMFVNRLLRANGTAFQQLFWAVMRAKHGTEFVQVRPQGSLGDGGNDGYLPADGHYLQVYGPIDPQQKISDAENKILEDFDKLIGSWNQVTPVREYSFAFNDKYEGAFTTIAATLGELENANPSVRCRPFTAGNLEDEFMSLSPSGIQSVLGSVLPDPAKIATVDYGVLREVIQYIMQAPSDHAPTRFGDLPTVGDKIALNNLCSAWGDIIRNGARQSAHVDAYFAKNSTFMKQSLRDQIVERYQTSLDASQAHPWIPDGMSREDLIFEEFRGALLPQSATVAEAGIVNILIGYYFETCDVFESHAE